MTTAYGSKPKWQFADHPWISYLVLSLVLIILIILFALLANLIGVPSKGVVRNLFTPTIPHLLTLFVLAPFVLRVPNGRRTFPQYLADIRLVNVRPFLPLLLLGIGTSVVMLLSLMGASILFRIFQGIPITSKFLISLITNLKNNLPPASMGWIISFPAVFEEISYRGISLVQFNQKYSERTAIIITALTFGLFHLINLLFGLDPLFVFRQVIWGCLIGIFYAVMVLRVNSLLPAMIFHYMVNLFMGSAGKYFLNYGTPIEGTVFWTISLLIGVPLLVWIVRRVSVRWFNPGS